MDLVELIPKGKSNAITRQELCELTCLKDRDVRERISQIRRERPIISAGKGYYLPESDEEVRSWIEREGKRARSIFWSMRGAKQYLNKGDKNNGKS